MENTNAPATTVTVVGGITEASPDDLAAELQASAGLRVGGSSEPLNTDTAGVLAGAPVVPLWLAGADAEERRELEALGVVDEPVVAAEAERDALVSTLLRAVHEYEVDVARFNAAEQAEAAAIRSRYDRLRAPSQNQLKRLGAYIKHVARGAVFAGRKKSRSVGWGSYGLTKERDSVNVVDGHALMDWLVERRPDMLTLDIGMTLDEAQVLCCVALDAGLKHPVLDRINQVITDRDMGYSNLALKTLVLGRAKSKDADAVEPQDVPGVARVVGADIPWFESEPPYNG